MADISPLMQTKIAEILMIPEEPIKQIISRPWTREEGKKLSSNL